MKTTERSSRKITIEATKEEITKKGFDAIWDEVREIYPDNQFDIDTVKSSADGILVYVKLKLKND